VIALITLPHQYLQSILQAGNISLECLDVVPQSGVLFAKFFILARFARWKLVATECASLLSRPDSPPSIFELLRCSLQWSDLTVGSGQKHQAIRRTQKAQEGQQGVEVRKRQPKPKENTWASRRRSKDAVEFIFFEVFFDFFVILSD